MRHTHDWKRPYEVVGGCRENPGVWHDGEIMTTKAVCRKCGKYRIATLRFGWTQVHRVGRAIVNAPDDKSLRYVQEVSR